MKTQSILKTVLLAAGFSAFTLTGGAQAQVLLTGGQAGDGWTAPADSIMAYGISGAGADPSTMTIQGVAFRNWNNSNSSIAGNIYTAPGAPADVTVSTDLTTGGFASFVGFPGPLSYSGSANADDQGMAALMTGLEYNNGNSGTGPLTISITGLAAGNYVLDEFWAQNTSPNRSDTQFGINGSTTNTLLNEAANSSYVVENDVTVTGAGTMTFSSTDVDGGTATLAGFDLSVVAAPEPSTMALVSLGALGLAFLIRRHRTA